MCPRLRRMDDNFIDNRHSAISSFRGQRKRPDKSRASDADRNPGLTPATGLRSTIFHDFTGNRTNGGIAAGVKSGGGAGGEEVASEGEYDLAEMMFKDHAWIRPRALFWADERSAGSATRCLRSRHE